VSTPVPDESQQGLNIDWRIVGRAALSGLVLIIPVVIVTAILEATIDDFSASKWQVLPFLLILFAYAAAGYAGGRLGPWAPYAHGILAALGSFAIWCVFRVLERVVRGAHIGFGPRAVMTNAMFAAGLGLFGAAIAGKATDVLPPPGSSGSNPS
jgi:hypothetical protein